MLTTAKRNRATSRLIRRGCPESQSECFDKRKNIAMARNRSIQKKETPLHSVRRSRTMMRIKTKREMRNGISEICHKGISSFGNFVFCCRMDCWRVARVLQRDSQR